MRSSSPQAALNCRSQQPTRLTEPTRLIERDVELETLTRALSDCAAGEGGVVVVRGVVGSGKTTLLHVLTQRAERSGAVVLHAAASRSEQDRPFGVISQLVRTSGLPAADIDPLLKRVESETPSVGPHAGTADIDPAVTMGLERELWELIRRQAESRPVVIGVDEVHDADRASLDSLLYVARRMRSARVLLVLNEDCRAHQTYPWFHAELFRQPNGRRLKLPLLSADGVSRMIADVAGARPPEESAACHRVSGGNPLLLGALLEDARPPAGGRPAPLVPGEAFRQAVSNCLYRCGETLRDCARVRAVLGDEPASPAVLAEVLGLDTDTARQATEALVAMGLLDNGRFRHEAVRDAVLDSMTPDCRSRLHADAARVLRNHGRGSIDLARHLIAASPFGESWATPVLLDAARQAIADNDVTLAIDSLRAAHESCADERQRMTVLSALMRVQWRVNPAAAVRHLPELTAAARLNKLSAYEATQLIAHLLWHGRTGEAREVFTATEETRKRNPLGADEFDDALNTARLWLGFSCPGPLPEESAGAAARHSLHRRALSAMYEALTGSGAGSEFLDVDEAIQRFSVDNEGFLPATAALVVLIYTDRLDEAALSCDSLVEDARKWNAPMWCALLQAIRAHIHLRTGDMRRAADAAREALQAHPVKSWGIFIGSPLASLVLSSVAAGRHQEAEEYLRVPVTTGMFRTPFGLDYLRARGRYFAARGRPHAALGDFRQCGELMGNWRIDLSAVVPWRTDAAEMCLALGRKQEARQYAREQLALLRPDERWIRGTTLRVLAASEESRDELPLLRESLRLLEEYGDRYEQARTLLDLSLVHRSRGDVEAAHTVRMSAARLADACGFELPGDERRPGTRHPAAGSGRVPEPRECEGHLALSDAERRVASLAVAGRTNRQIARQLFLTVSTVEQHLTRVYRKLRVRSRTDLTAEILDGAIPPSDDCGAGPHAGRTATGGHSPRTVPT
ncbi:BREX system ATP-binding domain-containing protein [Streptomyces reniochalinae]|uniref:Helix-turn-helix transcriptional regulator n=1 Tax=Streptomyces reniochalinae TaxID=2250578 RepID=A0A367EEU8_9ACTN|nr:LuxR family transcriptional regulator [Streptomyces reniochalinae]RCG15740.1 helix-turn-helix transcriptional regulator [Streptomyces reniochalinae]